MTNRPVKIYVRNFSDRLSYIAGILLSDILGLSFEITSDKRKLGKYTVINYSEESIKGALKISPDKILFEKSITPKEFSVEKWKDLPVFFQTSSDSDLPFDVFAASFFIITRYEEYFPEGKDEFGRFKASGSVAYKNGFLRIPVIERWAFELAKVLLLKSDMLTFRRNDYNSLLTIDSDEPFAYPGNAIVKSVGKIFQDILGKEGQLTKRYGTILGLEKDPYEVFDYITGCLENKTPARLFFPVGNRSSHDKQPSWNNGEYKNLIKKIAGKFDTGLHPTFDAAFRRSKIISELGRLKAITGKNITSGRFHYIRFKLPDSYRYLLDAGITEDYSMGYPDEPGFRAGISRPYYFFDLLEDKMTSLKVIPFQISDEVLTCPPGYDKEAAMKIIETLIGETRKSGGLFVSIWHNTSLLENNECKKWREVFEFMIQKQIP